MNNQFSDLLRNVSMAPAVMQVGFCGSNGKVWLVDSLNLKETASALNTWKIMSDCFSVLTLHNLHVGRMIWDLDTGQIGVVHRKNIGACGCIVEAGIHAPVFKSHLDTLEEALQLI